MARPPIDRSKPVTYSPAPPPAAGTSTDALTRAVWDELNRLAQYLQSLALQPQADDIENRSRRP